MKLKPFLYAIAVYAVSSGRVFDSAKIATVADVVFRRSPKFLGPREQLPTGKEGMTCGAD